MTRDWGFKGNLYDKIKWIGVHIGVRDNEIGIKGTGLFSILGKVIYDKERN